MEFLITRLNQKGIWSYATMSRYLIATVVTAMALTFTGSAHAQYPGFNGNRNIVNNSGNGAYNNIDIRNRPQFQPFPGAGGGYNYNRVQDSGNGIGNNIQIRNGGQGGFGQGGFPGGFGQGGFPGGYGQGGFNPGYFPGGQIPGFGGVNVNVITNSGNGIGNNINLGNRGNPGGVNINVITNSGNGAYNNIGVRNR